MREALRQAARAVEAEEVPVGAVIVRDGRVIARAFNQVELLKDATAHAEILVITQASQVVGDWRLEGCSLYVTKEPCLMCAGAMVLSRMERLVFGAPDPRGGGAGGLYNAVSNPALNHQMKCRGGILEHDCALILKEFFRGQRKTGGE
ncbi:MAG: nucleoside deaminase [Verrucomicrobia bacterium]|nr:nucleoside deaminase [Verrucomicrobiota bacterium]